MYVNFSLQNDKIDVYLLHDSTTVRTVGRFSFPLAGTGCPFARFEKGIFFVNALRQLFLYRVFKKYVFLVLCDKISENLNF